MDHQPPVGDSLAAVARSAVKDLGVGSAAVFVLAPGSTDLVLGAAEGIEGPPLERLAQAVREPAHPIARTLVDAAPSFDVTPTAPGGPALRSHVPLLVDADGGVLAVGVLAVAYDDSLSLASRQALVGLAARAAAIHSAPPVGGG
jgi:hypothetical protein